MCGRKRSTIQTCHEVARLARAGHNVQDHRPWRTQQPLAACEGVLALLPASAQHTDQDLLRVCAPFQVRFPPHTLWAITMQRMARSAALLVASKPKQCRNVNSQSCSCSRWRASRRFAALRRRVSSTVLGDLAPLLAVSQLQARLQQMLNGSWEGQRRPRSDLRHLPTTLQQMGQTTLMESELESVVGRPAVVKQKSVIVSTQNYLRLLISSAEWRIRSPARLPPRATAGAGHPLSSRFRPCR